MNNIKKISCLKIVFFFLLVVFLAFTKANFTFAQQTIWTLEEAKNIILATDKNIFDATDIFIRAKQFVKAREDSIKRLGTSATNANYDALEAARGFLKISEEYLRIARGANLAALEAHNLIEESASKGFILDIQANYQKAEQIRAEILPDVIEAEQARDRALLALTAEQVAAARTEVEMAYNSMLTKLSEANAAIDAAKDTTAEARQEALDRQKALEKETRAKYLPGLRLPGLKADPTLGEYIYYLYLFAFSIAGILVVVVLVIAGVIYLSSGGNPNRMATAKSMIISALTGLVLLFCSWLILRIINPDLLRKELRELPASGTVENVTEPYPGKVENTISDTNQKLTSRIVVLSEAKDLTPLSRYDIPRQARDDPLGQTLHSPFGLSRGDASSVVLSELLRLESESLRSK